MGFLKELWKREKPVETYQEFWSWFQKNEKAFHKVVKDKGDVGKFFFDKLSGKLNEVRDGFFYLTGMAGENTVELVFTADGSVKNIVFVEELVSAAPEINGWMFTALKPALDIKDTSIEMAGYKFNGPKISFYSNDHHDFPDEIDITIVHDDLDEDNKPTVTNGVYIFLDNFLGELNFVTTIDTLSIVTRKEAAGELMPIEKLKDFLIWRQKEFIEKYEGTRRDTENDDYSILEAQLKSGNKLLAVINTDLLEWDSKASHPWILNVEIKFDGKKNNGMPDDKTYKLLNEIETGIADELKDFDGYLNIGRQTADNVREIYFACKDFRKPAKVLAAINHKYAGKPVIKFDIYKDKYWQSFNRFTTGQ